jgi:hypothetical protein
MAAIAARLAKHGVVGVETWSWSNVGVLHVQSADSLETWFRVSLHFNSEYMTAGVIRFDETICNGCAYKNGSDADPERERSFYHLEYEDADRMEAMLDAIGNECEREGAESKQ